MKLFEDKFELFFNDLTLQQFKEECLSKSLKALQVKNGNIPKWNELIDELESYSKGELGLNEPYISIQNVGTSSENIELSLRKLLPWRKGPFLLNDLVLESEWHGDLKWQRLNKKIRPLKNKRVLDIGAPISRTLLFFNGRIFLLSRCHFKSPCHSLSKTRSFKRNGPFLQGSNFLKLSSIFSEEVPTFWMDI